MEQTDHAIAKKGQKGSAWVNLSAVVLLVVVVYLGATTGNIAGLISSIFPLFSPFLLYKFIVLRNPGAVRQNELSGKFLAVAQSTMALAWLTTALMQSPQMFLLVLLVPVSLAAMGLGWLVGMWLKNSK